MMQPEPFEYQRAGIRLYGLRGGAPTGDEPTLVFLHYFGGAARTWQPVLEALQGEFPCVALDLPGSGQSRVDWWDDLHGIGSTVDLMAVAVGAFVADAGFKRYVLVGHSMGGKVALTLAASHGCPPGLTAVALVAPSPPTPEPMPDAERARLLAGQGSESAARETLEKVTAKPLPADLQRTAVEDQVRVTPAAWRSWLEYGSRLDLSARLERLKAPVFSVAGAEDANITARLLRRELNGSLPPGLVHEPEVINGAAHLLPLEAPAEVADFVRRAATA